MYIVTLSISPSLALSLALSLPQALLGKEYLQKIECQTQKDIFVIICDSMIIIYNYNNIIIFSSLKNYETLLNFPKRLSESKPLCTHLYISHCLQPTFTPHLHVETISVFVSQRNTKGLTVFTALTCRCTAAWSTCPNWSTNLPLWLCGSTRSPGRIELPRERAWAVWPSGIRAGGLDHLSCECSHYGWQRVKAVSVCSTPVTRFGIIDQLIKHSVKLDKYCA